MDYAYLARERALCMAQADWRAGQIGEDQVIPRARQYEAYLTSDSTQSECEKAPSEVGLSRPTLVVVPLEHFPFILEHSRQR